MLFAGCKSHQGNVAFWRALASVFHVFILIQIVSRAGLQQAGTTPPVVERCGAEVVLSYEKKGEEKKGGKKI